MKMRRTAALAATLVASVATLNAQQPQTPATAPATPPPKPAAANPIDPALRDRIVYRPMHRGEPDSRVHAGTRGDGDELSSLFVLAPPEVGLTTRSQPTLFWFQTRPAKVPFELALLRGGSPKPLLHVQFPNAQRFGIQRLSLAEHGITLEPAINYQWVVALIRDPESRSRDIVSSGWIRRVPPLALARPTAADLAAHGLWYDALETISSQIRTRPEDKHLRLLRDDFLGQSGLALVVDFPAWRQSPAKTAEP